VTARKFTACPGSAEGLARVIKSVIFAGITAVIAETIAGSLGNLATVPDAWT
jgi:hypothetical protein